MCEQVGLEPRPGGAVYSKRARSRCVPRRVSRLVYRGIGSRDAQPCPQRIVGAPGARGRDSESECADTVRTLNCLPRHSAEWPQPASPEGARPDESVQPWQWAALGRVVSARHHPPGPLRACPAERRHRGQVSLDARRRWPTPNRRATTRRGRPSSPVLDSQRIWAQRLPVHGSHFSVDRLLGGGRPRWQRSADLRHEGHLAGPGFVAAL